MTEPSLRSQAAFAVARIRHHLGTSGLAGVGLLLISTLLVVSSPRLWNNSPDRTSSVGQLNSSPSAAQAALRGLPPASAPDPLPPPTAGFGLASEGEIREVIAMLERTATAHGLAWKEADYKLKSESDTVPASFEIRVSGKGTYLGLRRFLDEVRAEIPSLVIRSLSVSRASAEASEVEARLTVAILLSSLPATAIPASGVSP